MKVERDPLEYVLNRMEHAAQSDDPAGNGYGPAREELLSGIASLRAEVKDLNEVLEDKRRLTRELDVAMHGEEGAAKQASLCDLIEPANRLRARLERVEAAVNERVLPLLNYIEATPDEGILPGDWPVILFRAKELRAALAKEET